jgi:hypothetical protein
MHRWHSACQYCWDNHTQNQQILCQHTSGTQHVSTVGTNSPTRVAAGQGTELQGQPKITTHRYGCSHSCSRRNSGAAV